MHLGTIDSFEITYTYLSPCHNYNQSNSSRTDNNTVFTVLHDLQQFSMYSIEVVAINRAGKGQVSDQNHKTFITEKDSKIDLELYISYIIILLIIS